MSLLLDFIFSMDVRLALLTFASFLLTLIVVKFMLLRKHTKLLPPGPWSLPIVGYLPNVVASSRWYGIPLPAVLSRLSKKYGPVSSMYMGDQLFVVLGTHDVIKEAFMHPNLNDRPITSHTQNNEGKVDLNNLKTLARIGFTSQICDCFLKFLNFNVYFTN